MSGADDFGWEPSASSDRGALTGRPNNIDAEATVLSAMLLSGEVVEEALVELMPDDFYRPSHKTIFVAMSAMYESSIRGVCPRAHGEYARARQLAASCRHRPS